MKQSSPRRTESRTEAQAKNQRSGADRTAAVSAPGMYPAVRMRRNRKSAWSRRLVAENVLTASDLIWPIFLIDGATRRVYWSPQIYRIYGRDPSTFTPTITSATDAFDPDDAARVLAQVERAFERGDPFEFEARLVHHDGTVRRRRDA